MYRILLLLMLPLQLLAQKPHPGELEKWKQQARQVQIITDQWGIPHIYGKTDADAVFGLMYVQCSQNFARVERNYLEVFGRLAELDGEQQLYNDLQMQMIYDTAEAKKDFAASPAWMKKLLNAFADGVNFYLATHPEVKPAVLHRFEPWFPLMYTDGSISATQLGGLTTADTRALYPLQLPASTSFLERDETGMPLLGSNGFAVAPSRTKNGNAMLYINPHVTFYFRTEAHMVSEEGLNAYGAATWGNFFIYQGFNEHCGWMHTSSYGDVADLYKEDVQNQKGQLTYRYNSKELPVRSRQLVLRYRKNQQTVEIPLTAYATHHGPLLGKREGKWLSLKERNRSLSALEQSWLRTKAHTFSDFKKVMELRSNVSNNTVYADDQKNIAYWHGNFMPVRDQKFNWTLPVDGTTNETEWKGLHTVEQVIHIYNPLAGWIQNCNSTPFTAAGKSSPKPADYPSYMAPVGENARAVNAARLLQQHDRIDLDQLIAIGYNRHLAAFDILLPSLFAAYDSMPAAHNADTDLAIGWLKQWDRSASESSISTTLATEWATKMMTQLPRPKNDFEATNAIGNFNWLVRNVKAEQQVNLLKDAMNELVQTYGGWKIAWGDLNRFQRTPASTNNGFSDTAMSLPVGLASSAWGCLPSFVSRRTNGTLKRYGVSGNSFVAAVEFGKKIKARTIMTGGESFNPASTHFLDQAEGFLKGQFKEINFYKDDVLLHAVHRYHPGEE